MRTFAAALAAVLVPWGAASGHADGPAPAAGLVRFEFAETHMGSEFKILLYSPDAGAARRASRAAFDRIAALDRSFSDYDPTSELMRLCDQAGGPPVPVSEDLFAIFQRSKAMFERSAGAFDVTAGPVIRLWRRARRERKLPAPDLLSRTKALVSSDRMHLDPRGRTVRLELKGMKLDLGGIAKGYASEAAVQVLRAEGVASALVAGAGDIAMSGPPPGEAGWSVGIGPLENPAAPPEITLLLSDRSVSTSGDAERFVEIDGRRYSHIVDPRTGLGVEDRCSVTTIAPEGATADALATAVYGLGPERGLALVDATAGASAYVVRQTKEGRRTFASRDFGRLPRAPVSAKPSRPVVNP